MILHLKEEKKEQPGIQLDKDSRVRDFQDDVWLKEGDMIMKFLTKCN